MNIFIDSQATPVSRCSCENEIKKSIELSLGALIAILNLTEILLLSKKKKKIYEIVLLSLSVSDCMFGLANVFVNIVNLADTCISDLVLETIYTMYVFSVLTSIFHLLFIAMDRVIAVLKPLQYKMYLKRKNIYIFLSILWILAVAISATLQILDVFTETFAQNKSISLINNQTFNTPIPFLDLERNSDFTTTNASMQNLEISIGGENSFIKDMELTLSVVIILADIMIILCYSLVIYMTTCKRKISRTQDRSKRLPFVCVAIAATFVLFTFPYAVVRLATGQVPIWANFLLVTNSGMNSLVYFFRNIRIPGLWKVNFKTKTSPNNFKVASVLHPAITLRRNDNNITSPGG